MYKQGYANKAMKAVFATVLAMGLMIPSGIAPAKTTDNDVDDATFKLTGVGLGDVVHAYQIFDTDIDDDNNLIYTAKISGLPAEYDSVDKIIATNDGRAVADAIAAVIDPSSSKSVDKTADDSGTATLTLDSGYYLVTVTSNSGNTKIYQTLLVNATPNVENGKYVTRRIDDAAAKVQSVTPPDKQIVDPDDKAAQSTDKYSVGDTASFLITGTIPSYPSNATHAVYSITDVPDSGLAVDEASFVVKSGNDVLGSSDYTLTQNSDGTFTVAFSKKYVLAHVGQTVTIEYKASVESISLISGKVGNKVYGTFSPNPYEDKVVDTDENTPYSWAQTYGFSFRKLTKDGDVLSGAGFTITDEKGNPVKYVDASGVLHTDGKVTSDDHGWVYVNGLEEGVYKVSETTVPSGYQKVDDFFVTLSPGTAKSDSLATSNVAETNFNTSTPDKVDPKLGELPTTGGAGTIALTAGGILLVVGGSTILIRSRRRDQK